MDAYSFANSLFGSGNLKAAPPPPGNAAPSFNYVQPLNPSQVQVINTGGQSPTDNANSSWSGWLSTTKNILTAPIRLAQSSFTAFNSAGDAAGTMVKTAATNAVSAVTGLGGFMKWIVVGLVAFAIIYGLFLIAPFVKAVSAPLSAGRKAAE